MIERTPINKGNYDMEPPERLERYEKLRGYGWEEEYRKYRECWTRYPREHYISDYPLLVDIELSSICNLKCPMCYTITEDYARKVKRTFMELDLFHKIVDEIAGKVPAVRLSLRGEPTIHPEFIHCIQYCKEHGIREVSFLTNLSTMTKDFFILISKAGADWITASIDGLGQQYESVRKPLKFEETLSKIKMIHTIKEENNWYRPVIKIQGIWPAIRNNPSEYYDTFAPFVDQIAFNPLIDYLDKDEDIIYEPTFSCPQLYQRLVVGSDGNVLICSNDESGRCKMGNIRELSIFEIWHGEKINSIRKLHNENRFKEVELCKHCYLPRVTEESEHAIVDGRELIIKNYVNRPQNIGE